MGRTEERAMRNTLFLSFSSQEQCGPPFPLLFSCRDRMPRRPDSPTLIEFAPAAKTRIGGALFSPHQRIKWDLTLASCEFSSPLLSPDGSEFQITTPIFLSLSMAPADAPIGRAGKEGEGGEAAMGSRGIYTPSSLLLRCWARNNSSSLYGYYFST